MNSIKVASEPEELDLDLVLEDAFIRACKTTAKKAELPILTSNFFRVHVIPACPPHCSNLDIKKTKWKKLSKFLAEKQAEGIITIKEPKKGVETITDINQEHPKILEYKVIKYEGPVQLPFQPSWLKPSFHMFFHGDWLIRYKTGPKFD